MCQTRTISYTCSHFCTFRLSKCHAHYLAPSSSTKNKKSSREERKPSCSGHAAITIYSQQECGPCSKERVTKALDEKVAALVLMTSCGEQEYGCDGTEDEGEADECRDTELVRLQEERDRRLFVLDKEFPDWRYKKNTVKPEKGFVGASSCSPELSWSPVGSTPSQRPQKRPPSKLRTEVLPEDIALPFVPDETYSSHDADWGWADSSSGKWPSLADEIAENEAAREAASITVSWGPWAGQKSPEEEALYQSWSADQAVKETKSRAEIKEAGTTEDNSDFRVEDRTNQSPTCDSNPEKGGVNTIDEKVEQDPGKDWEERSFDVLDTLLAVH
ncbi:hypothetical protein CB0940_08464 [Cercospora beticola]|uniref:Uncharacterized protein n=1 Tax=Cercospora beticola TaxID=122368 RepID=A0A2G5HQV6_CERBT|nr:hypothetical protein CB0940_08464 [Cercospora beticola]PIA94910.1 hypothetical protein CB0940_08464 [Cercospora beticola]WPB05038.1 hypothetical protein RHO25_009686 [Cercospora beticola]CAK1364813.1 unnamed protein product [Cercospora beticola]